MTSSAKRTDPSPPTNGASELPIQPVLVAVIGGAGLLLLGWLMILHKHHWHFTVSVFFMSMGWFAVLLTASYLWKAGWAAAVDDSDMSHDEFWKPVGAREELETEKKLLLKAIKEIDFDREMGKMSDEDAAQLTQYYRNRAIDVIKALAAVGDDAEMTAVDRIERELEARLSLEKTTKATKTTNKQSDQKTKTNEGSRAEAGS